MLLFDRLQVFVPEGDRESKTMPVDIHDRWDVRSLKTCGRPFGGATSYGCGVGARTSGQRFYWDSVTVIEMWTDPSHPRHPKRLDDLTRELLRMGHALSQETVGVLMGGKLKLFKIGGRS